ncbi:MucR family transcriptional regulator [Methylobacterium sp. Leaf86]|uniref:MucR family transcriptional regulator n=1 Tax=Methylobacterium sp. Leaf86 TaxID=1736242 RepID=UPI0006FBDEE8|nr:MucR family transcriptional regulator [Methylobacterium sp. Leaf86]KQO59013.1 MucR family transcriptional regulator [Methylobacterium sp. Leaf86]
MANSTQNSQADYIKLAADIVAAYVSANSVPAGSLTDLLSSVHAAISSLTNGGSSAPEVDKVEKATPAQIKKSITPDHLISYEDGKPYRTMKRHLTLRGLSPEAYRAKHGLPADYPMVSASYSAARSALAKQLGLGQQRNGAAKAKAVAPEKVVVEKAASAPEKPKKAARPRKAAAAT